MKVLIVEDFCALAKALAARLQEDGVEVQCVVGFRKLDDQSEAVDLDGQDVTLTMSDFDVALVDGCIEQFNDEDNSIEGPAVIEQLVKGGVACLGISTVGEINEKMVSLGAVAAVNKAVAFGAFIGSHISAQELALRDMAAVQRLHDLRDKFSTDEMKPLRRQCDALVLQNS